MFLPEKTQSQNNQVQNTQKFSSETSKKAKLQKKLGRPRKAKLWKLVIPKYYWNITTRNQPIWILVPNNFPIFSWLSLAWTKKIQKNISEYFAF